MNKQVAVIAAVVVVIVIATAAVVSLQKSDKTGEGQQIQQNIEQTGQVREIPIVAKQFSFEPTEITISQGERVRLIITSEDVPHGFSIDEYGIKEDIAPGKVLAVDFIADKPGEFKFYCSTFCGAGHGEMAGKMVVK